MSFGFWQIAIIVLVVVLLFGAGKIPRLMKDVGSGVTAFRKGLKDDDNDGDGDKKPSAIEGKGGAEAGKAESKSTDKAGNKA
jgi:sec-independent protein translocase protein TatA